MATNDTRGTVPLSELDDFKVADGAPDVRGWDVVGDGGRKVGEVKELLVSPEERRTRYLCVELDGSSGRTLVPIGAARLDDEHDRVIVPSSVLSSVQGMSGYTGGAPSPMYERSLRDKLGIGAGAASYAGEHYDEDRFYGRRHRLGAEGERRLVRMEEELKVDKRRVQAGEVHVRKHVETEHVRESVPVTREEVTVERRPVSADAGLAANARIGEDDISVPVMREEVVASKRAVPKEEVVVRTRSVADREVVEEDLRKERIDADDTSQRVRGASGTSATSGTSDRGGKRGLGERLADKVDDVKDRMDGNPRSRPGRDATDADTRL